MEYYDGLEDAPDSLVYRKVWLGEHILKRAWWWFVGMPPADELRETYSSDPFTDKEEDRIRELVQEEMSGSRR